MSRVGIWEEVTKDFKWYIGPITFGAALFTIFWLSIIFGGMKGLGWMAFLNYPVLVFFDFLNWYTISELGFLFFMAFFGSIYYALIGLLLHLLIRTIRVVVKSLFKVQEL